MSKTYAEIRDSHHALQQTFDYLDSRFSAISQTLGDGAFDRCVFLGSGSSFSLAKSLAAAARMMFGGAACALSAGDVALRGAAYEKVCHNALIVVLSRSGETSELGLALDALEQGGAQFRVLGIYCAQNTTLARRGCDNVELPWAFDTSVCQTRSVTNLYGAGMYLLARYAGDDGLCEALRAAADGGDAFLETVEKDTQAVARLPFTQVVVLGDGELGGLCEEGSLAFKEICQLPSNFYHVLDCRHGPFVLFGPNTLVLLALSGDHPGLEAALVADVVAKGCHTVTYSDQETPLPGTKGFSFGRPLSGAARGIPFILLCQLISYYKALERGTNPDQPDGLSACIKL